MSAEMMIRAYEVIETDARLTTLDKLLLLRWAWKSQDAKPYEIKFKTMARELSASRNAVKASVARLVRFGYLYTVAVKVTAGPMMSHVGSVSDPSAAKQGGQPVTPRGSVSDPQRGRSVTPLQRKEKKKEPPAVSLDLEKMGNYARACLREGKDLPLGSGRSLKAGTAQHVQLAELLANKERA